MTDHIEKKCDVLIIGASLAGSCLARQLRLKMPDLNIVVIDKKTNFDYWVGEATVPPWVDYASRHCGLGPYLAKTAMLKHGIRYFYDSEKKDLPLWELSEFGRREYPVITSYQLDRSVFDRDLCEMNREIGIEVMLGTALSSGNAGKAANVGNDDANSQIVIDPKGGHLVQTTAGPIRCRWLVDATGMRAVLPQQLGLMEADWKQAPSSAYWGRYEGANNIDRLGPEEWRRRVGFSERNLSTNSYMYRGYWIWHIPVTEKISSIGVCVDDKMTPLVLKNADELTSFFREHRCLRDILGEKSEPLDFLGLKRMARHTREFCSVDRWFVTGMSASFIDPLFSSNTMTIAALNLLIGSVIEADRAGNEDIVRTRVDHFNAYFRAFHETNMRALDYRAQGCFEGWAPFRMAMLNFIVNRAAPEYYRDLRDIIAFADKNVGRPAITDQDLSRMTRGGYSGAIIRLKDEHIDFLDQHGRFYELNAGNFLEGGERGGARRNLWNDFSGTTMIERAEEDLISYEALMRHYVSRRAEILQIPWSDEAFVATFKRDFRSGQSAEEIVRAMGSRRETSGEGGGAPTKNLWSPKGPPDPNEPGWTRP